jgi:hypothetical protein
MAATDRKGKELRVGQRVIVVVKGIGQYDWGTVAEVGEAESSFKNGEGETITRSNDRFEITKELQA